MSQSLDNIVKLLSAERGHLNTVYTCFNYFRALAETRRRGHRSDFFEGLDHSNCLDADLPRDCDDDLALRLRRVVAEFIEKCPEHPVVGSAFHILRDLSAGEELKSYFLTKLRYYYAQGDAGTVFQLCSILAEMGMDIFRDENGVFIQSRSSCEAEKNMAVARRFLERHNAEPAA